MLSGDDVLFSGLLTDLNGGDGEGQGGGGWGEAGGDHGPSAIASLSGFEGVVDDGFLSLNLLDSEQPIFDILPGEAVEEEEGEEMDDADDADGPAAMAAPAQGGRPTAIVAVAEMPFGQGSGSANETFSSSSTTLTFGGSGTVAAKEPQRRRPKRRQGVACDTCRLRRVRCDLTEREPGLGCSRCKDKNIRCTDEYIQMKKKPKRTGRRIEEAKVLHGSGTSPDDLCLFRAESYLSPVDPVTASLINTTLTSALSLHLITVFFETAHHTLQVLPERQFLERYAGVGFDAKRLGKQGEVLCAVLEAWGARISGWSGCFDFASRVASSSTSTASSSSTASASDPSGSFDSPTNLANGPGPSQPKRLVLDLDVHQRIVDPGRTADMSKWGEAREAFAGYMLKRAERLVDETAVMRTSSPDGTKALLMLAPLSHYTDRLHHSSRIYFVTAFEQLQIQQLTNRLSLTSIGQQTAEAALENAQQNRVFWYAWISDALSAAAGRRLPRFLEDDIVHVDEFFPLDRQHSSFPTWAVKEDDIFYRPELPEYGKPKFPFTAKWRGPGFRALRYLSKNICGALSPDGALAYFILTPIQVGSLARFVARHISSGVPSAGLPGSGTVAGKNRNLKDFSEASIEVWQRAEEIWSAFDVALDRASSVLYKWKLLRPLAWSFNVKIALMDIHFYIHWVLFDACESTRVREEEVAAGESAFMELSSGSDQSSPESRETCSNHDGGLRDSPMARLYDESCRRTLLFCRKVAGIMEEVISADLLKEGWGMHLAIAANYLSLTPTRDSVPAAHLSSYLEAPPSHRWLCRGGEGTEDWTWEKKCETVDLCLRGLGQLGWTWGAVKENIEVVEKQLRETAPKGRECKRTWDVNVPSTTTSATPQDVLVGHPLAPGGNLYGEFAQQHVSAPAFGDSAAASAVATSQPIQAATDHFVSGTPFGSSQPFTSIQLQPPRTSALAVDSQPGLAQPPTSTSSGAGIGNGLGPPDESASTLEELFSLSKGISFGPGASAAPFTFDTHPRPPSENPVSLGGVPQSNVQQQHSQPLHATFALGAFDAVSLMGDAGPNMVPPSQSSSQGMTLAATFQSQTIAGPGFGPGDVTGDVTDLFLAMTGSMYPPETVPMARNPGSAPQQWHGAGPGALSDSFLSRGDMATAGTAGFDNMAEPNAMFSAGSAGAPLSSSTSSSSIPSSTATPSHNPFPGLLSHDIVKLLYDSF